MDEQEGRVETPHVFSKKLNTWLERERRQSADHVRLVLIGKTGVGKSATGNTILGNTEFKSSACMTSITKKCEKRKIVIGAKMVHVIDTPGLFDTAVPNDTIREEIGKCIAMASPGPHVFLLLIAVGRFTQEERDTVLMIQDIFGEYAKAYTMVAFTRGEDLDEGMSIEEYIKKSPPTLQELIKDCGGRYHVFCNKDKNTRVEQVSSLLRKIDKMIYQNGGSFYTTAMFEETEEKIRAREMRLLQQRLEDLELAYKDKDASFLASEISKIKVTVERKFKSLLGGPQEETDEYMRKLEDLRVKLERSQGPGAINPNEMDSIIFAELHSAREGIRKKAEKAEAKALAKTLKAKRDSCTIS